MVENSNIEWTDHTFNPWIGCTKVGPGCDNCYAEELMDKRYKQVQWGSGNPRKLTSDANWKKPLQWDKQAAKEGRRYRVFCASLADVFDNEVPNEWRSKLFDLIAATPNLDWLLLTKRIGNAWQMLPVSWLAAFPKNIWMGATIVNQAEADRDIDKLIEIPAPVLFLSMEPLLGAVDLHDWLDLLDWVIVGGESGRNRRAFNTEWAEDLASDCEHAKVAFFMKQIDKVQPVPSHLMIRQFPESATL